MLIAQKEHDYEALGVFEEGEFTIEESGKTFRMYIDKTYSDKIAAPVREVITNAEDSHQGAEQEKRFFVHCPNALDPSFFVRDYGEGMDHEKVMKLYTRLGKSDKTDTNKKAGMFGIGSKAPFAYADQFYVTTFDGAEARHYVCAIGPTGRPRIALMDVEASTEERGVRVGVSVEKADFGKFETAIRHMALAFHDHPFETNLDLKQTPTPEFSGADWIAWRDTPLSSGYGSNWWVRMGHVFYPLTLDGQRLPQDRGLAFVVDVPLGEGGVEPVVSREGLEYKPEAIEYLNARVTRVVAEIEQAVRDALVGVDDVVDYFDKAAKMKPDFIKMDVIHPLTGLKRPNLNATFPTVFFSADYVDVRWEFQAHSDIDLKAWKTGTGSGVLHTRRAVRNEAYVVDIRPLLDPSRDFSAEGKDAKLSGNWLSKSEFRRVSRFIRAYLEKHNLSGATFFCNVDWSEEFWTACLPNQKAIPLTFDDLRGAVPQRVVAPESERKQRIHGLAIAKAAGDQKPVYEIAPPAEGEVRAYVTSDQYRQQSVALFKFVKQFDFKGLYIASPTAEAMMAEHGIPSLADALKDEMAKKDVSFYDWYALDTILDTSAITHYLEFLRKLHKHDAKALGRLTKGKGEYSKLAKLMKPLVTTKIDKMSPDDRKAVQCLIDTKGDAMTQHLSANMLALQEAVKRFKTSNYNPTRHFVDNTRHGRGDQLPRLADAIIQLETLIPPGEEFAYSY